MNNNLNNCGIYKITNIANGKIYIGQSFDIKKRWKNHKYKLKNNKHINKHLQKAYNKYGVDKFQYSVVLYCEPKDLTLFEQRAMDVYLPEYNICKTAGSTLGYKHSDETKAKISAAEMGNTNSLGHQNSDETKAKMSAAQMGNTKCLGHKHSDETKAKMSAAAMGKPKSEETRANMSAAKMGNTNFLGHKHSDETKAKISAAEMGNTYSLGHKHSDEARANMSAAQRLWHRNNKIKKLIDILYTE